MIASVDREEGPGAYSAWARFPWHVRSCITYKCTAGCRDGPAGQFVVAFQQVADEEKAYDPQKLSRCQCGNQRCHRLVPGARSRLSIPQAVVLFNLLCLPVQ